MKHSVARSRTLSSSNWPRADTQKKTHRMCLVTEQTCEIVLHSKRLAALIRGAQFRIPTVLRRLDFLLSLMMAFLVALFFQKVFYSFYFSFAIQCFCTDFGLTFAHTTSENILLDSTFDAGKLLISKIINCCVAMVTDNRWWFH